MKSLLLAFLLVPVLAMAADEAKPKKPGKGERKKANPEAQFTKMDTSADGNLSLDEFKAARGRKDPSKVESVYKRIDKDSDGKLTLEEFIAHEPKKGRKPGASKPAAPKKEV